MTDDTKRLSEDADGAVRAQYDWSSVAPSVAVIETTADALDRSEMSLESLYESIDPDALDSLFRSAGSSANANGTAVTFSFADRCVTVHGHGVVVKPPQVD